MNITEKKCHLFLTSGDGPRECRRAIALTLKKMKRDAAEKGFSIDVAMPENQKQCEPGSAVVTFWGIDATEYAQSWLGTLKWICKSPFRPHHKRQNWFIGIFELASERDTDIEMSLKNLRIETYRAGGPGGQHQNTTDSAVRITHLATGIHAVSCDERSQHRNKQTALRRLESKLLLQKEEQQARSKSAQNQLHRQLERGNPIRVFKGEAFKDI